MRNAIIVLAVVAQLIFLKSATFVQTVGSKHFQISIVNKGSKTAPLGGFTFATAYQIGVLVAAGAQVTQDIGAGNDVLEITIAELPS